MKVDVTEVESVLLEQKFNSSQVAEVLAALAKIAEELKADRDSVEKEPWEHVIVLHDKEGYLDGKEIAGWVVQKPESDDGGMILGNLKDAAKAQNEAAKRKKNFITNFPELFEDLKPKFLKKKMRVKTKELTRVLITDGKF